MCDRGDILESRDAHNRQVLMCSECGSVFVVIHACDVHLVIDCTLPDEVRDELGRGIGEVIDDSTATIFAFGDMDSACVGAVSEGRGIADQRTRAAAAWN